MTKANTEIENFVIATLSFFEPMTFSQIILDFDRDLLTLYPNFDKEELLIVLGSLEKKRLIKRVKIDKETGWIRSPLKRSLWRRFLSFLRL